MLRFFCLLAGGLLASQPAWSQSPLPTRQRLPLPSAGRGRSAADAPAPPGLAITWGWYEPSLPAPAAQRAAWAARTAPPRVAYCEIGQAAAQDRSFSLPDTTVARARNLHRHSTRLQVLLRLRYQPPAAGSALAASGQDSARQQLAAGLAQLLLATRADGVSLLVSWGPPPAAALSRPLRAGERAKLERRLNQQRRQLNATRAKLGRDTAQLRARWLAAPAAARLHYERPLWAARQQATDFSKQLTAYRRSLVAWQRGQLLEEPPGPAPVTGLTELRAFMEQLRHQLDARKPGVVLLLTLPWQDSSRHYAALAGLAPFTDQFELLAPGRVTESAADTLGQLVLLQAALRRSQAAGIPAGRLRVVFPHAAPRRARAERPLAPPVAARPSHLGFVPPGPAPWPAWVRWSLLAAAGLAGLVFLGVLLYAGRRAAAIVPFWPRLGRVALVLAICLGLLAGYSGLLAPERGRPLLAGCLGSLGLLAAGLGYHRYRQPAQLP